MEYLNNIKSQMKVIKANNEKSKMTVANSSLIPTVSAHSKFDEMSMNIASRRMSMTMGRDSFKTSVASDEPVTFRHTLARICGEVAERTAKREQRHEEFLRRFENIIQRYEKIVNRRINRLREDGVYLDKSVIRLESKKEMAKLRAARKHLEKLRRRSLAASSKSEPSEETTPTTVTIEPQTPSVKLEQSFHSQLPIIDEKEDTFASSKHSRASSINLNIKPAVGDKIIRRAYTKVLSVQRFAEQRRNATTKVPISSVDVMKDSRVPNNLLVDAPGKCSIHAACHFNCKGRLPPGLAKSRSFPGPSLPGLPRESSKSKLKNAVRKLGSIRHLQS